MEQFRNAVRFSQQPIDRSLYYFRTTQTSKSTVFVHASQEGYGACLYIHSENQNHDTRCRLLCAKSRVAPLKSTTIPRLELCGALLLAKLYYEVQRILGLTPNKIVLWSDSTIVLHWIKTPPHRLKTFIAHRVTQIQRLTNS